MVTLPLLVGLSHFVGFEPTSDFLDDAVDACVAYGVAFVAAGAALMLLGVIDLGMSAPELIGKVSLQAVPGSIGALLAQSQFGGGADDGGEAGRRAGYDRECLLMAVGALFLALPVAPTQEMLLIAFQIGPGHTAAMAAVSLAVMHAFVYAVQFRGSPEVPPDVGPSRLFLQYTVVGYAITLLIAAYVLWSFGRLEGSSAEEALTTIVVLAFPGSIGAAAARLIF